MTDMPPIMHENAKVSPAHPNILVQSEEAGNFFNTFGMESGRHAHLGRPEDFKHNSSVYNALQRSNADMAEGLDLIHRIVRDATVNDVVRHEKAEKVATKLETTLVATKTALETEANNNFSAGAALVNETMKADPNNAFRDSKLHDWIRETAAKPDGTGIGTIREAAMEDRDVAIMLWVSKPFLLGINAEVLGRLKMDAVKAHVPKAQAMFEETDRLNMTAQRYAQITRSMKASFFNKAVAEKARSRVNV